MNIDRLALLFNFYHIYFSKKGLGWLGFNWLSLTICFNQAQLLRLMPYQAQKNSFHMQNAI